MKTRSILLPIVILIIVLIIIIAIVNQSGNKKPSSKNLQNTPEGILLNKLKNNQAELVEIFKVKGLSQKLTGLAFTIKTNNNNKKNVAFTDKKSKYLFDGALFSADGKNLTQSYTEIYNNISGATKSSAQKSDEPKNIKKLDRMVLADLKKTYPVKQGSPSAKKTLTVIMDPNCPWCHREFLELQPYIESNELSVNWVIVGILKKSSIRKTASILSAKDPLQALKYNEEHLDEANEIGGVTEEKYPITRVGASKATANLDFFEKQNFMSAPLTIYENKQGEIILHEGYADPEQIKKLIANIK
jgi:thiol:disulfide interchange protein DsbG